MGDRAAAEITALLGKVNQGDRAAREELLRVVYDELEAIARGYVDPGASLEPRGLVHELYIRLAAAPIWAHSRKHFYATAALAMRQILADRARKRKAAKRDGNVLRVSMTDLADDRNTVDAIAIDDALTRLEALSERQARIVELRCLIGMSVAETADTLDVSERTVHAEWRIARAWLSRALGSGSGT